MSTRERDLLDWCLTVLQQRERADAAEARCTRLEEALREICAASQVWAVADLIDACDNARALLSVPVDPT